MTLSSTRLSPAANPAAAAGVPTSSAVRVSMTYANGATRDMTLDSRTVYNTTLIDGFARLVRVGNIVALEAIGTLGGSGTLGVSFTHTNISSSVGISVVVLDALLLDAAPYPRYPGSASVSKRRLSAILGTAPQAFQQVSVWGTL